MEFLIAGLLVLNLAAVVLSAQLLEREARRRHSLALERAVDDREEILEIKSALNEARRDLSEMEDRRKADAEALRNEFSAKADAWLAGDAETVQSLSGLWKESERQTAALQILLARDDASETLKKLQAMLEESPPVLSREEETQLSKAMEEGISSILGYTAGKVPGVELHL